MQSSTVRSGLDPTITKSSVEATVSRDAIVDKWKQSGRPDMVAVLRQHPSLLRDRSVLLNLVIEEYRAHAQTVHGIDLETHCSRFQEFGSSIQRSIQRQLEVQQYIDQQPDLLNELGSAEWPKAGDQLGRFQVIEELGSGSIAHVYLCFERDVGNRPVVVKATPIPSFEASILGRLNHPHITPIYSTGYAADRQLYYLCTPYCGRSTLADVVDLAFQDGYPRRDTAIVNASVRWFSANQVRPQPAPRRWWGRLGLGTYVGGIVNLAIQVADALDHAHQIGVLHGDLKPSNVLLTPDGRPLLLDFNLARDCAATYHLCGGTLPYMPPEHLQYFAGSHGRDNSFTPEVTSDVYSFGALFYELLAGVTPAHQWLCVGDVATTVQSLFKELQQGVPPLRQYNPLVSRRLESLMARCLSFDRRERPETFSDVKQLLKSEQRSFSVIRRQARVRPILFSAVVGVPLVVAAGMVTYNATHAPRYLADYEEGLRLVAENEPDHAARYFASAVDENSSFLPARFQLARMRLALGEHDLALKAFEQLAQSQTDPPSMAYVGYCFNLKKLPVAAIPWYERALQHGVATTAVYNNLGASYLNASSQLTRSERLDRAEYCLNEALQSNRSSPTVQFNLVRHAVIKSQFNPAFDPSRVWRYAESVLASAPHDPVIAYQVALWHQAVRRFDAAWSQRHDGQTRQISDAESDARIRFAARFDRKPTFGSTLPHASDVASARAELSDSLIFLDPVLDGMAGSPVSPSH